MKTIILIGTNGVNSRYIDLETTTEISAEEFIRISSVEKKGGK